MGKVVSIDQSHELMAKLATSIDWKKLDGEKVQAIIVRFKIDGTAEKFQKFLESLGLAVAPTLLLFGKLIIDVPDIPFAKAVEAGHYDDVSSRIRKITDPSFLLADYGRKEISILYFKRHFSLLSSSEVIAEMDKAGYRPANLRELLAIGVDYPDLQGMFPIVALGSSWVDNGVHSTPRLWLLGRRRRLSLVLSDAGWSGFCKFAAVRKEAEVSPISPAPVVRKIKESDGNPNVIHGPHGY